MRNSCYLKSTIGFIKNATIKKQYTRLETCINYLLHQDRILNQFVQAELKATLKVTKKSPEITIYIRHTSKDILFMDGRVNKRQKACVVRGDQMFFFKALHNVWIFLWCLYTRYLLQKMTSVYVQTTKVSSLIHIIYSCSSITA